MFGGPQERPVGRMDSQELRGAKFSVVTATPHGFVLDLQRRLIQSSLNETMSLVLRLPPVHP